MNDLKTIRQLIKMMVDNDLSEIDLEGEGEKIKLKRGSPGTAPGSAPGSTPGSTPGGGPGHFSGGQNVQYLPAPPGPAAAPGYGASPASGGAEGDDADLDDGTITIDSPMVGTFYTASNPESEAFVSAGDSVKPETVVCIVEAMKVFNEIKSECTGTIVEVLLKNGDAVEYGQPMYKVKP